MFAQVSPFTHSLSILAPTLGLTQCVAQAWRIRKEGARGVSLDTWLLSVFVAGTWTGYGIVYHVIAELASNLPFIAMALVVIVVAGKEQEKVRKVTLGLIAAGTGTVGTSLSGLSHSLHWFLPSVAVCGAICIYLPQLVVALRESDLGGISLLGWWLAIASAACWGAYGLLIHQMAIALPAVVMIPASTTIVVKVHEHRKSVVA
jgi:uncharacterized protein with PQ loop repeat